MSINISGKISLPEDSPEAFPAGSRFKVKFEDVSIQDTASVVLGEAQVDLACYRKEQPIEYTITCRRPTNGGPFFSVSGVLNVGWAPGPNSKEWVRLGDYLTDTMFNVEIEKDKTEYIRDFHLIHYQ